MRTRANHRLVVSVLGLGLGALSILWASSSLSGSRYLDAATVTTVLRSPVDSILNSRITQEDIDIDSLIEQELQELEVHRLPARETVLGAQQFVLGRRLAYHEHNASKLPIGNQWKLRGHGYLYNTLKLILAAEGPNEKNEDVQMGRNVVKIWNVHNDTATTFQDCHLLTLWVRVNGPEIFAGGAHAIPSTAPNTACHWEFEFDIQKGGQYEIDAKALLWNGNAATDFYEPKKPEGFKGGESTLCPETVVEQDLPTEVLANSPSPYNNGFLGFKLYNPLASCCEVCRRTKGCIHWSTPPTHFEASFVRNGCQLYYNRSIVPPKEIPKSHWLDEAGIAQQRHRRLGDTIKASGTPKSNNTDVAYFIGCGWSFHFTMDFPCLSGDEDDQIYMLNPTFVVEDRSPLSASQSSNNPSSVAINQSSSPSNISTAGLPLCQLKHEAFVDHHRPTGRWVREDWPNRTVCPIEHSMDPNLTSMFQMTAFDPDHPHCWHRDDLSLPRQRCVEPNCRLIKESSKWQSSKLHQEKEWMGVWRNYDCNLLEFTNTQLQQCITQRRISSIERKGASIAAMSGEYLQQRLANLELSPKGIDKEQPSLSVVIDSLQWPHELWSHSEKSWIEKLHSLPDVTGAKEHFILSSFFATSERENYVQVARAERFARLAATILPPKGYKMINAFELSAAFAYDTAAQGDGLHIIGPPMKAVFTKIFHYLCSDVVDGSIA